MIIILLIKMVAPSKRKLKLINLKPKKHPESDPDQSHPIKKKYNPDLDPDLDPDPCPGPGLDQDRENRSR